MTEDLCDNDNIVGIEEELKIKDPPYDDDDEEEGGGGGGRGGGGGCNPNYIF